MSIRRFFTIIFCCIALPCFASIQYLEKFNTYQYWYTHLPPQYNPNLVQFISQPGPLAQQLRNKWLNYLGEQKNWNLFSQYYRPTPSVTLQCYAATAYWKQNSRMNAIAIATPLWLSGHSQPSACNEIFHTLSQDPNWRQRYWRLRIIKAIDAHEMLLARQLLNRGNPQDKLASSQFWRLQNQPEYFVHIPQGPWKGEQTLYALKRMIELHRKSTSHDYQIASAKHWLNEDQKQRYIAHQALYAFMRDEPDALAWMMRVNKKYYNPTLLEWDMRHAILHQNWSRVAYAISQLPKPYEPEQQYWLAEAQSHLNLKAQSQASFRQLAKLRHYYGFLASRKLHLAPSFQENMSCHATILPYEYKPLLQEIHRLYHTNTLGRAAQMLNDFILELPQSEKCALVHWVLDTLNWPTEAIALSNQPALFNQISVRFPTKYAQFVKNRAHQVKLDPAFVYAIIRQESAFHPTIVSPVGARGLMQMMPKTAQLITRNYRIPYRLDAELFTPYKNIEIGTQYLSHLSHLFGHHPLLVAAAYNAGPQAVNRWIKQYPSQNIEAWIDTLPWKETRNYLKNIITFQTIYQHRLGIRPNMENMLRRFPRHAFQHDRRHF